MRIVRYDGHIGVINSLLFLVLLNISPSIHVSIITRILLHVPFLALLLISLCRISKSIIYADNNHLIVGGRAIDITKIDDFKISAFSNWISRDGKREKLELGTISRKSQKMLIKLLANNKTILA